MVRASKKPGRPLRGDEARERVSFTLPPKLHQRLKTEARRLKLSKSELVERQLSGSLEMKQIEALQIFARLKRSIEDIAARNKIRSLALFGSVLKREDKPESDIDLLVEFEDRALPGLLQLASIEAELSEVFGRKVDLRTAEDLSRYFRDEVRNSAVSIYEN